MVLIGNVTKEIVRCVYNLQHCSAYIRRCEYGCYIVLVHQASCRQLCSRLQDGGRGCGCGGQTLSLRAAYLSAFIGKCRPPAYYRLTLRLQPVVPLITEHFSRDRGAAPSGIREGTIGSPFIPLPDLHLVNLPFSLSTFINLITIKYDLKWLIFVKYLLDLTYQSHKLQH